MFTSNPNIPAGTYMFIHIFHDYDNAVYHIHHHNVIIIMITTTFHRRLVESLLTYSMPSQHGIQAAERKSRGQSLPSVQDIFKHCKNKALNIVIVFSDPLWSFFQIFPSQKIYSVVPLHQVQGHKSAEQLGDILTKSELLLISE